MTSLIFWPVLASLTASFSVCLLIILTQRWHGKLSLDHDLEGVQKIHDIPVPRIGGVGVVAGMALAGIFSYQLGNETYETAGKLLLCAIPVFASGLIEDFTKRVGVRTRLFASFISAAFAYWAVDSQLIKLDTIGLDYLMQFGLFSFIFTCFAVGGMTNAINIIDGLNGLASGSIALMLGGLATIAWMTGDTLILEMCLWGIAGSIGFFLLNYPFGKIFLGDGGAYLSGFWLAECCVLLLKRNPNVSTWAVLLICIYPTWETIYSIYRREILEKVQSGVPDRTHLHHIILENLRNKTINLKGDTRPSHASASFKIWILVLVSQPIAAIYHTKSSVLAFFTLVLFLTYTFIYRTQLRSNHQIEMDVQSLYPNPSDS